MMRALQPARRGAKALACRHLGSPATAPQSEPAAAQPRWLAELGAVRTDWTCVRRRRGPQPRRDAANRPALYQPRQPAARRRAAAFGRSGAAGRAGGGLRPASGAPAARCASPALQTSR
jgi:hypothetical protein